MSFLQSNKWKVADKNVILVHNFTDTRSAYDFITGGDNIKNGTLFSTNPSDLQTGANFLYN